MTRSITDDAFGGYSVRAYPSTTYRAYEAKKGCMHPLWELCAICGLKEMGGD